MGIQEAARATHRCRKDTFGAPITYVANQLGHASPDTTLRYYAQWIPGTGRRYVDVLDVEVEKVGTKSWHQTELEEIPSSQVIEKAGAGRRTRTADLLITKWIPSQLRATTSTQAALKTVI